MFTIQSGILFCLLIASGQLSHPVASFRCRAQLEIVLSDTTNSDGTYFLKCHPPLGTFPNHAEACAKLDKFCVDGVNPFAPTPSGVACTEQYGGPQKAVIRGIWNLRRVDAIITRTDGCEIWRWNNLVPVVPAVGA